MAENLLLPIAFDMYETVAIDGVADMREQRLWPKEAISCWE